MNGRERMLAAARGESVDRAPVWVMQQAGRHLPEFRRLRAGYSYEQLMRTPSLAAEAAEQPLRRYPVDAAAMFCDVLEVLDAMGATVSYGAGGSSLEQPLRRSTDLVRLRPDRVQQGLGHVAETVQLLARRLHPQRAVLGVAGAPLTLAAYLVEGSPSRNLRRFKGLCYQDPALADELLGRVTEGVARLLELQIKAGADLVQVFDAWAGQVAPGDYERFAIPWLSRLLRRLEPFGVPVVVYLRGAAAHLPALARLHCAVLALDHSVDLAAARSLLPPELALQGNLDPAELLGPEHRIRRRVRELIAAGSGGGHIVNLGRGVTADVPPDAVACFVDEVVSGGGGQVPSPTGR